MKHFLRASLLAALVSLALAPAALAGGHARGEHGHGHGHQGGHHGGWRALVFSRTAAFRHTDCIQQGTSATRARGGSHGFAVDATEEAAAFSDRNLGNY